MAQSLGSRATQAQEAIRTLERTLASTRPQWSDATRQSFDQRHADVIVSSGRKLADELAFLAQELAAALGSLEK
ncbi:hypothetical protein [Blastococcus sp. SYSU DS0616]